MTSIQNTAAVQAEEGQDQAARSTDEDCLADCSVSHAAGTAFEEAP